MNKRAPSSAGTTSAASASARAASARRCNTDVFFHIRDFRGGTGPAKAWTCATEIHVGGKGPRDGGGAAGQSTRAARCRPSCRAGATAAKRRPAAARGGRMRAIGLLVPAYVVLLVWAAWTQRLLVPVVLSVPLLSVLAFYLYWRDKFASAARDARRRRCCTWPA